jgi:galactose oxidase-like protein
VSRHSASVPAVARAILAIAAIPFVAAPPASAQNVTWNPLNPATSFPLRAAMATAYDPVSARIIAFGGFDAGGHSSETWAYDGTDWAMLTPATPPTARAAASMAFDAVTQTIVLFGGFDGHSYLGDTWIFDGATSNWSQAFPTHSPTAVTGPNLFTDPSNGHAVVFGGFDGVFYSLTTYRWTGSDWSKLSPTRSPSARGSAIAALDPLHANVVLFGGLGSVNPDNTWTWDGSNWTRQRPTTQPALRYYSSAAFEPHLGGVLVFGGGSGGQDQDDTWLWTGSDWSKLAPAQFPSAREQFALALHEGLGHIVLAGGDDPQSSFFSDTWEFVDEGQFVDLGPGVGGSLGVPTLDGKGDLSVGSPTGFTIALGNALPNAAAFLLVGLTPASIPFKGGTLYPFPIAALTTLVTDGSGVASLSGSIPSGVPSGTTLVFQTWMSDPTAPKGMSGSNGLEAIVP